MDSSEGSAEAITQATSQLQLDNAKTPQQPARPLHRRLEEDSASVELGDGMQSETSSHDSQRSRSKSSQTTSTANAPETTVRRSTKVYYHIDDEQTPYCTEVHVPAERITLGDFKKVLNRSNFKYYCKAIDQQVGGEVKAEIRDDNQLLNKSFNGQIELFLLTSEGSSHSDGTSSAFSKPVVRHNMVPGPAPSSMYAMQNAYLHQRANNHHNQFGFESGHRNSHYRRQPGMHTPFEDSTIYTESDGRIFSDDESRVSTSTDNITSVSRQHHNLYRRRRRQHHRRQPSRASSMSSMTETSMALEVITVTLNMDTVNFLGISIVGQSCSRGDNGIYVANVMPGGAVALDGRIEPGDMILQVNDISFENFTNDQAVDVLKEAVNKRGPIKLTVAKSFDGGRSNYFMVPSREPVRPIDTQAWVQHTNAVRGMLAPGTTGMNSIPEGSEGAPTPIPGQYPPQPVHFSNGQQIAGARPSSSSTTATSNGSGGGQTTIVGPGGVILSMSPKRLDIHTEHKKVVQTMAMSNSGLDIRNRTWLKIPIPMSFLGSALIDWLTEHVDGLRDRKDGRKYASELLKEKLIAHVVNKITFTEQCYYVFGEECAEFVRLRTTSDEGSRPDAVLLSQHTAAQQQHYQQQQQQLMMLMQQAAGQQHHHHMASSSGWPAGQQIHLPHQQHISHSVVSEHYASMPPMSSPYPGQPNMTGANAFLQQQHLQQQQSQQQRIAGGPDIANSQASNNSNEGNSSSGGGSSEQRRKAVLPPAPSISSSVPVHSSQQYFANPRIGSGQILLEERPGASQGRNSFRVACNNYPVEEFFVDHL